MHENREAVFARMLHVFKDVFDDDSLEITEETAAKDIDAWDSLMHVTLCVALEQEFGVRLNAQEIANLNNVGSFLNLLLKLMRK